MNSLLSVVGLQVLLYLRVARSSPASTAAPTWPYYWQIQECKDADHQDGVWSPLQPDNGQCEIGARLQSLPRCSQATLDSRALNIAGW